MSADVSFRSPKPGPAKPNSLALHKRIAARVEAGIAREALAGIRHAATVRSAALAVVAAWMVIDFPFPDAWFYLGFLVVFLLFAMAHRVAAVRLFPAT